MKKLRIMSILLLTIFMTGCVKFNANMKIHKDKSMDYEIIMAFDKKIVEQNGTNFDNESLDDAKKNGFKVSEYDDGEMIGYRFTKHIKNIDSISTTEDITGNLDVDNNSKYIFTVKKGFLKNTYKAKLTSSSTDLNELNLNNSFTTNDNELTDSTDTTTSLDNMDYTSMTNMELKFEVSLPYNAINSNATINNGKNLTWSLLSFNNNSTIEFEFELYNYQNLAIIAIAVFIILIIIVILLNKKKKKKKENPSMTIDTNFGQANNISNIKESMQAQDVWTDENVQVVQPYNPMPEQPTNPIQTQSNVFEQELQNQNNQN